MGWCASCSSCSSAWVWAWSFEQLSKEKERERQSRKMVGPSVSLIVLVLGTTALGVVALRGHGTRTFSSQALSCNLLSKLRTCSFSTGAILPTSTLAVRDTLGRTAAVGHAHPSRT